MLGPATPAHAHAALVSTAPAQGAVVGYSPTEVALTFSEPVRLVPGKVQVLAPDGKRINSGQPRVAGGTVTIPIRVADRPLGTYLVSYRVISADSHPVAGSITFSVGAPSASAPQPRQTDVDPVVAVAVPVAKYLGYVGLALVIGPTVVLALLWPRRLSRVGPIRLVRAGLALVGVSAAATLWLQAPYASGAAPLDVSAGELRAVLATGFGAALVLRLAVVAAAAVLLGPALRGDCGRARAALLTALAATGAATWPLAGHAAAAPLRAVNVIADAVHVLAMAAWLGGLVMLAAFLLRQAHPRVLARLLPVWSRWAALAVCWLVLTGGVRALLELGSLRALTGTDYGRLLAIKVGVLALVLGAAAYARRLAQRGARTRPLRRTVLAELAGAALVLGLSAVLVQTPPGRAALAEARVAAADGFAQTLTSSLYTLQFDIYPVQIGENNTVHAYAYTADGKRLPVVEWRMTAALPARGVEPASTRLLGLEPHHAVGAVTFAVPGDWELRFTLRTSEIDQATVTTTVRVS
ncbi:copper transport protein [Micromonospora pattaloongensis]|uniref:Copper transport protein n=1 Tax=Micromonospora pattaloongensis TaxID=405436 RepID=A0A1H3P1M4_9ACTN|nr:copper transport protein [Micromonospora pattaloongensis]